jgi:hypothetical protein
MTSRLASVKLQGMEPQAPQSSRAIDVTGLPEEAIQAVQAVVALLRGQAKGAGPGFSSPEEWARAIREWAEGHTQGNQSADSCRGNGINPFSPPSPPLRADWWEEPVDPAIAASTPPEILEAQVTFFRELPELLKERQGQWVAYYGARRLGFAATKSALRKECWRQGFQEVFIRYVEPHTPTDYI